MTARPVCSTLVVALCGVVLLSGCSTGSDAVDQAAGAEKRFVAGDGTFTEYDGGERPPAPRIQGDLLDGGRFDLQDLRGNVVVFNFWGSWCAPCRAEADDLVAVYESTRESGVEFVGVNVRDTKDKAEAFERNFGISYPSLFDPSGRVALRFRDTPPNAIPATIIVDRDGGVAAVFRKAVIRAELQPVVERVAGV